MGRFYDFIASKGSTLDMVATAIHVRVELLENADLGRQPLPLDVADRIGIVLGIDPTDIAACVSRVTTARGELAETPLPPEYGDSFRSTRLAHTAAVVV